MRVRLQSVGDLQGDPMLIPFSLGILVFAASGSFLCFQWFLGGLDEPGVLGL